jgi:DNA polymerase III subunit gamma/tau
MSYQVLARKWRPANFDEVVGQEHIVRSLAHALDNDRLHHAMLFTGTRGVGKTTIARILAKALNCEEGVSSHPCGKCDACISVDEGRFIDLIEVDAASRTKVEQTRELLDNVQYTPSRGRYKIYLIDEVHMLSASSFNALLKTLEEPPEHVKFLLATTDPQKLPITVLSRCMQFNLKHLFPEQIQAQLDTILESDNIQNEAAALQMLSRAAEGSMRDGLSLLDQAIAYGNGKVLEKDVRQMLGSIEQRYIQALIEGLLATDTSALFTAIDDAANRSPDFMAVLNDMLAVLYQLSLVKVAPDITSNRKLDVAWLEKTAAEVASDELQLLYQIALIGKRDLPLAPDFRTGFEMVMLRMLAFRPAAVSAPPATGKQAKKTAKSTPDAGRQAEAAVAASQPVQQAVNSVREPDPPVARKNADSQPEAICADPQQQEDPLCEQWLETVKSMNLIGMTQQLALHAAPESWDADHLKLVVDISNQAIASEERQKALVRALKTQLGERMRVSLRIDDPTAETPAQRKSRLHAERQQKAEQAIRTDPVVEELVSTFDATIAGSSIQAINKSQGAEQK